MKEIKRHKTSIKSYSVLTLSFILLLSYYMNTLVQFPSYVRHMHRFYDTGTYLLVERKL